jgi:hypothetical protein
MKLKLRASLSYFSAVSYFPLYLGTPEFPFFFFGVAMAVYRKKTKEMLAMKKGKVLYKNNTFLELYYKENNITHLLKPVET